MAKKTKNDSDLAAYRELIAAKSRYDYASGFECNAEWPHLFPFQRDLTRWALRLGRAALFVDTGLGKTRMQCTYANEVLRHVDGDSRFLILAPLAVAQQTIAEAALCGIEVRYVRGHEQVRPGISIANYEMLDKLDATQFVGVALDESSIMKNYAAKTRTALIEAFARTPYRLACTATPAPNDFTELGNHAEFLGIKRYAEMLAMFFTHDGSTCEWFIKGHAREKFWKWVCSWAALVKKPSDLGYSDDGYVLPPLEFVEHVIPATQEQAKAQGKLFVEPARGLTEQRLAQKSTMAERIALAAKIANESNDRCVLWCHLNAESVAATKLVNGAVEITGSQSPEEKAEKINAFSNGTIARVVTKPDIAGMGVNWQKSHVQIWIGVTNSYEEFYQAVRRQWRFGQEYTVTVHVITSELEGRVLENLKTKQAEAEQMAAEMSAFTREYVQANVKSARRSTTEYNPTMPMMIPAWLRSE